ncbi:hypothetical protein M407DRAFT_241983 [Tulasnella calospora MUT 4182]|uniref:Uncharacterized protein n=1 Tax=Tulasnella calospora MUT 4182 TaxID=1051891 RepID=A0A0C3MBH7_9AGAM|nr:hypothetical protein M407DRAFT_241983 [Tulasnella calospora MUT 4182]
MSADASVESLLSTLRQLAIDPNSAQAQQHQPGALIAKLRAVNRNSNTAANSKREVTAQVRTAINATNLQLQNLMYEKRHLEREIEKCRQFAFIYQDIPIHDVEEFQASAPEELQTPDIMADEHQLMLSRLQFELSERQRLQAKKETLDSERNSIVAETEAFQKDTDGLAKPLEDLGNLMLDVQQRIQKLLPAVTASPSPAPEGSTPQPLTEEPKDETMQDASTPAS